MELGICKEGSRLGQTPIGWGAVEVGAKEAIHDFFEDLINLELMIPQLSRQTENAESLKLPRSGLVHRRMSGI